MAHSDIFPELLAHPCIVGTLRAFMGPAFVMSDNGLCIKQARTGSHVGWHRDSTSWLSQNFGAFDGPQRAFWEAHRAAPLQTPMEKVKVMIYLEGEFRRGAPSCAARPFVLAEKSRSRGLSLHWPASWVNLARV
jgi:hypothetical protein